MKKLLLTLLSLTLFGIVSSAQAGGGPNNTRIIAHCGCNTAGDDLEWVFVDVGNGRGHNRHRDGNEEFCLDETETPNKACLRTLDDCVVAGPTTTAKGNQTPLILCSNSAPHGFTSPTPGTSCGESCDDWSFQAKTKSEI